MTHGSALSPSGGRSEAEWRERIENANKVRERALAARRGMAVFEWPRLWPRRRDNHEDRIGNAMLGPSRTRE